MPLMDTPPYRIGLILIDGFALMSYAAVAEPFRAANLLAGRDLYDLRNLPAEGDAARSSGGAVVPATGEIGQGRYDLLIVVAGGDPFGRRPGAAINWLRRMARQGATLGGVSGGPVILAEAGLMDGRRMTVHWEHLPTLAETRPDLLLEQRLYVIDRDRVTCAGGAAPMDMTHALISQHHGAEFARRVSDWFLHTEVRPATGPQRAGLVERVGATDRPLLDAVEAMESHLADPLTLEQLAGFARVSGRQLGRLFKDRLNITPMEYYRDLRLDLAKKLLTTSALSLTEVALATGFANSAHFSRAFAGRFGAPPSSLRRRKSA